MLGHRGERPERMKEGQDTIYYITADGFHITAKGRRYLAPLIRGEDYPPYKNGLPQYIVLKNAPVRRKLRSDFAV